MDLQNTTVAEIAAESLAAVKVFESYGIDYCCGGKKTVASVCSEHSISYDSLRGDLRRPFRLGHPAELTGTARRCAT